ncbi:hypothetical protein O6H91_05G009400 [Diphasiastrum complanatum]|uniref:Uncharacterized protein n=2 Tax=Diphasiastrum complanatum TaxID=34168 RepID=A0ACC2DKM9_DIPCM|nr:hypothetical protein O6H91_05G009400 [Diphasiastrum complanatum]
MAPPWAIPVRSGSRSSPTLIAGVPLPTPSAAAAPPPAATSPTSAPLAVCVPLPAATSPAATSLAVCMPLLMPPPSPLMCPPAATSPAATSLVADALPPAATSLAVDVPPPAATSPTSTPLVAEAPPPTDPDDGIIAIAQGPTLPAALPNPPFEPAPSNPIFPTSTIGSSQPTASIPYMPSKSTELFSSWEINQIRADFQTLRQEILQLKGMVTSLLHEKNMPQSKVASVEQSIRTKQAAASASTTNMIRELETKIEKQQEETLFWASTLKEGTKPGSRTIGVITKLDIMDRGTDARSFLLGNVVPLRLGYVGVVNRSQEDIVANRSIRDALSAEEHFFRSRPVYHSISDRCGVPQLAKRLNQILVHHIRTILPDLKARINTQVVTLKKELADYGELTESKSGQGVFVLNILTKYSHGFSSIVDGKYEEMPTSELSGGARIHYIFQAIFVKSLQDVDPCDNLTDEDIRTAIQNATGPKNVLFVPEVPFEVLIRRQIGRLLEPSLQCARFVFDELVKISNQCVSSEMQRFPILRRRIEEVVAIFLCEGLAPAETMITHLIEMEMDYINTSHSGFIGGGKAVEAALQQQRVTKDAADWKDSGADRSCLPERTSKARAILARTNAPSIVADPRPTSMQQEKVLSTGTISTGSWGISSIFNDTETRANGKEHITNRSYVETIQGSEPIVSGIQLKEPPPVLRAADAQNEQETVEILVTRSLLKSYYDIVRKNIQDLVPKAIMHFLVNHVKRELHNVFIKKLYRESLFEELLQEREDVVIKRKRCKETLRVLQQAAWTLEELPLDYEVPVKIVQHVTDTSALPVPAGKSAAIPQSFHAVSNGELAGLAPQSPSSSSYTSSPRYTKSRRSFHLEPAVENINGRASAGYPTIKT